MGILTMLYFRQWPCVSLLSRSVFTFGRRRRKLLCGQYLSMDHPFVANKLLLRRFLFGAGIKLSEKDDEGVPAAGMYRSPWIIMKEEIMGIFEARDLQNVVPIPRETDILVIGGGAIGSSVAYWLKHRNPNAVNVSVIERDPYYTQASTMLSVGGVRHQFSVRENVELSMFTTKFLRNIKEHLSVLDRSPPDVRFNHNGYLFLATSRMAPVLENNVRMQQKAGAKIDLMGKERLSEKFPWLNTTGIDVGSYGLEGEGWFDPWVFVKALKQKNISLGVKYVTGNIVRFEFDVENPLAKKPDKRLAFAKINNTDRLVTPECLLVAMEVNYLTTDIPYTDGVEIRAPGNKLHTCRFALVVNCAGPWAGEIAHLAEIGVGDDARWSTPLPVQPRKRFVYVFHCPNGPMLDCPMVIDPTNTYFRREGFLGHYICGVSPSLDQEPSIEDMDVDFTFFDKEIWPILANRVPAFEALKVKSAWAGYYDYNYIDENLVIGCHPYHTNFYFANGLSGHGLQHSIGVGRAISELIFEQKYKTVDLSRFSFNRFISEEYITEDNIV